MIEELVLDKIRFALDCAVRDGIDVSRHGTQGELIDEVLTRLLDGTDLEGILLVKFRGGQIHLRPYRGEDVDEPLEISPIKSINIRDAFRRGLAAEGFPHYADFDPGLVGERLDDAWNDTLVLSPQASFDFLTTFLEYSKTSKRVAQNVDAFLGQECEGPI